MLLKWLYAELKARHVRKTLAIYMSSALTAIGIVRLFTDVYGLPPRFFPVAVTLATCGLFNAFVFAWFHGKEGRQPFRPVEIAVHAGIVAVAVLVSFSVGARHPGGVVQPPGKSIAVLPFKNLSPNPTDAYFADGIMEDILTLLSKIGDLNVISRAAVMKYKGQDAVSLQAAGKDLGVTAILAGSVRREGNAVRISAQLIDAATGRQVWSEWYDRQLKDVFAIQTEVAQRIARELEARLSPEESERIEKPPTRNLEAYGFYLRGRDYYNRYSREDNERAIDMFRRAVGLDSTYALAYAGLADAYSQRVQRFNYPQVWADSSIVLSEKARSLDPNIPEPYKALGLAYAQRGWYRRAIQEYQHALRLNPNFASVVYNLALTYSTVGRHDEAIPLFQKAILLTPGRATYYQSLGEAFMALEEDSLAEYNFRKCLQLDPHDANAYANLIQLRFLTGRVSEASALADSTTALYPDAVYLQAMAGEAALLAADYAKAYRHFTQWQKLVEGEQGPLTQLGFVLQQQGRMARARALLDSSIAAARRVIAMREDNAAAYDLCRSLAVQGQISDALEALRLAFDRGWNSSRWTTADPLLRSLHGTDEFERVVERMRAAITSMRAHLRVLNLQASGREPL